MKLKYFCFGIFFFLCMNPNYAHALFCETVNYTASIYDDCHRKIGYLSLSGVFSYDEKRVFLTGYTPYRGITFFGEKKGVYFTPCNSSVTYEEGEISSVKVKSSTEAYYLRCTNGSLQKEWINCYELEITCDAFGRIQIFFQPKPLLSCA